MTYIPGREMTRGICHLCEQPAEVNFCQMCQHWFCAACRTRYGARLLAAAQAMIRPNPDKHYPCCGPRRLVIHEREATDGRVSVSDATE